MIKKKNLLLLDFNFCQSSLFLVTEQSLIKFTSPQETSSNTEHQTNVFRKWHCGSVKDLLVFVVEITVQISEAFNAARDNIPLSVNTKGRAAGTN